MGGGTGGGPTAVRALLGSADIARLTGVRRPAVSNWRRRFADFPSPVAGTSSQPLFALEEVQEWCREHDRPFEAGSADLLWQRVRAVVPDVRLTEFLAYAAHRLTGEIPPEGPQPPGVVEEWLELGDAVVDADDPRGVFEELCARLAHERGRAETDPGVAAWMAALAGVEDGRSVLDPACGTGTLLAAATVRGAWRVSGQDRDPHAVTVAATRLAFLARDSVTATGDSLRAPVLGRRRAHVVLCDPPAQDRGWGLEDLAEDPRWVYGVPPRSESELAWVQHCLSRVVPGGSVVVLLPASVSSRLGGRRLRANLLRAGALRAVLEVSRRDREATRHLWVLARPREGTDPDGRVLLVGAGAEPAESTRVWEDFLLGLPVEEGPRWVVADVASLMDDEVDLRPSRHLTQARGGRAALHYPPLLAELTDALEQARSLAGELSLDPGGDVRETTVGALLDEGALELHRAPMAVDTASGDIPVLTVRDVRSGEAASGRCDRVPGLVMALPGDVVVAETVREAPVRVVTETGTALGPRLVLLRPVAGRADPGFLAGAVRPGPVASARTSSGRVDVRSLRLPALPLERQRAHTRAWERLEREARLLERINELGAHLAELGRRGLYEGDLRPRENGT